MSDRKSWFNTVVGELAAAAHEHQPSRLRDDTLSACRKAIDEHDRERAVTEAAKAWQQAWMVGTPTELAEAEDALGVALDALRAAEKAEE